VLLLVFNALFTDGFFHMEVREGRLYGSLVDVLNRGTPAILLSLGMTLVIATGGIDLSVGSIMAIAGALAGCLISPQEGSFLAGIDLHTSIPAVVAIALGAGVLAGIWNGLLVVLLEVQPIVATLILMVAGRGVAQLITNGQIPTFENPAFEAIGGGFFLGLPVPVSIAALALLLTLGLARGTALGLFVEAVGNNPTASRYAGIPAGTVRMVAYTVCGLCAALAGVVVTSDVRAADVNNTGVNMELDAILAVAIGGTSLSGGRFSLIGSVLGALVMQTLTTTILTRGVPPEMTMVIKALVVVGVCLLQSPEFRRRIVSLRRRQA
jgi:simple sugar transport system permease protein